MLSRFVMLDNVQFVIAISDRLKWWFLKLMMEGYKLIHFLDLRWGGKHEN